MILLKKYVSIKNFLYRFTILKIGSLHIRFHLIVDKDRTTLYHNHPFNYISIILKGGYKEKIVDINGNVQSLEHSRLSLIKRKNNVYHRIEEIKGKTLTLFISWNKYSWNALNTVNNNDNGLYERIINDREVWSKKENGIWFIGSKNKIKAINETRHSIHQN